MQKPISTRVGMIGTLILWFTAGAPAGDPTVDWLMNQSATAPASQPTTQPLSPFVSKPEGLQYQGTITLSDGSKHTGFIHSTPEKPLRFFDDSINEYRDVPLDLIVTLEARVIWEKDEPEWHFKDTGSDIKEFTGKSYPSRETSYIVKLRNGRSFTGGVVSPLFVEEKGESRMFVLNKRAKGPVGQKLADLVYVTKVEIKE